MCGILSVRVVGRDGAHLAGDPVEPVGRLELQPAAGHELHADADAEKRPAFDAHRVFQGFAHAGHGFEAALAVGEGADARQHDTVGGGDDVGVGRQRNHRVGLALARGALEGLGGGVQVAGAVVDDGDALHYGAAFGRTCRDRARAHPLPAPVWPRPRSARGLDGPTEPTA